MQDLRFYSSGDKDQKLLGYDTDSTGKSLTRCQNLLPLSSGYNQSKMS
jgi:hypothetical protein